MAARMYMCRGACTCIHSAVPESAMPTRRSRGGHHDIHVQTCTCIHSTVHESTMPTRRSRDDHRYVCTCAGVHMHTQRRAQRPHTYEAKASEDGGRYEHVQTCTCIHSTVHESPMPTRRSRDGGRYADDMCRRAATCIQTTEHKGTMPMRRRRAEVAVGMYMCRHAYTALCAKALCLRG